MTLPTLLLLPPPATAVVVLVVVVAAIAAAASLSSSAAPSEDAAYAVRVPPTPPARPPTRRRAAAVPCAGSRARKDVDFDCDSDCGDNAARHSSAHASAPARSSRAAPIASRANVTAKRAARGSPIVVQGAVTTPWRVVALARRATDSTQRPTSVLAARRALRSRAGASAIVPSAVAPPSSVARRSSALPRPPLSLDRHADERVWRLPSPPPPLLVYSSSCSVARASATPRIARCAHSAAPTMYAPS